ncbi:ribose-phosphate diphosphokinase [Carboxydichorda subterranea]|uniref:ribose-phosphate diphosphokinase n=1 Tax=Carboxydichorda subterranea TaxID=3109565 RepID=UPI003857ADB2
MDVKIFGGRATQELTVAICQHLGVHAGRADIFKFSNDNTFVRILENVREADVFVVQTSVPPVDEALVELLIMLDALRRASAGRITAVLPYYPYVRSDKKDQPRVPITARLVADLLVTAGADRVVTIDLTADQIQGFFTIPVDHLTAQPVLARYFRSKHLTDAVVVAPDPGAVKRAQRFAERLGVPVAFVDKRRLPATSGVRATAVVGDVRGRPVILFDEEVDQGTTLLEATELVLERGAAEVYAACTHAVLSGLAAERVSKAPIRELVVTDTVPVPPSKRWNALTVLSVAPLLAETIRRISTGESVSALFE